MTNRIKLTIGAGLLALGMLGGATVPALAQSAQPKPSASAGVAVPTHQQMDQMMDAVHGAGTSQRMHQALGPNAEKTMDSMVAMMGQMQTMMNTPAMQGMMTGANAQGMQSMMHGATGQ